MAEVTLPPRDGFRLSQLLYDARYRSLTIQVVAAMLLMLSLAWLVDNTVQNLAALGKDFSFAFLWTTAGYDINQQIIPFSSQDTHARAALVGILNTLVVAFMGCILATVIGVLAGVLRLSKNFVVSGIMTFYVEAMRNTPLLIWILIVFAVMTEATPQPRDFREGGGASMILWDSVAISNRGVFVPKPVWGEGSGLVLAVFLLSLAAIFILRRVARKRQEQTGQQLPVVRLSLALFFLPTLLVFFVLGRPITLDYPALGGFNFVGGIQIRNSLIALWLALSLYTSAFIAEIVRSGILAVSRGQTEAAFALGMQPNRTMQLVILPQALRVIIPPLISQFLNLTKNSSLALAVGYMDVRSTLGGITINQTGREIEGILLLGTFYLIVSLIISSLMNYYNSGVKLKER
ncbi:ABC transporter permease subunit [uncultured Roseicyclus sp.]|uniref:amino acid ABC transporter permease n=1 Tax=uncultured Roseicyclus sp. TaxID=543072 RepID=UPI0026102E99|nr:ABC transporter permease subunit [uncultured Roseicyclus sp.]